METKPMDPFLGSFMVQAGTAAVNAISRGGPRRQYKWNKKAAADSNQMNRANAEWALEQNKRLQEEQRIYDSPAQQMARYKAAGLNPHLIYGSGSSAGSAFPVQAQGIAPTRVDAPEAGYGNIGSEFLQAGQMMASTDLAEQRVVESQAKTALTGILTDIAKTNPMLDPVVYQKTVNSLNAVADFKAKEAGEWIKPRQIQQSLGGLDIGVTKTTWITEKIEKEVESMSQRIGLNTEDLKIKNQILQSKEFENAIKEIQVNWLKDGDLSPEHIRQGLMLILSKMLGR